MPGFPADGREFVLRIGNTGRPASMGDDFHRTHVVAFVRLHDVIAEARVEAAGAMEVLPEDHRRLGVGHRRARRRTYK